MKFGSIFLEQLSSIMTDFKRRWSLECLWSEAKLYSYTCISKQCNIRIVQIPIIKHFTLWDRKTFSTFPFLALFSPVLLPLHSFYKLAVFYRRKNRKTERNVEVSKLIVRETIAWWVHRDGQEGLMTYPYKNSPVIYHRILKWNIWAYQVI